MNVNVFVLLFEYDLRQFHYHAPLQFLTMFLLIACISHISRIIGCFRISSLDMLCFLICYLLWITITMIILLDTTKIAQLAVKRIFRATYIDITRINIHVLHNATINVNRTILKVTVKIDVLENAV